MKKSRRNEKGRGKNTKSSGDEQMVRDWSHLYIYIYIYKILFNPVYMQ